MITIETFLAYPNHHHFRMITQGSLRRGPRQCSLVLMISVGVKTWRLDTNEYKSACLPKPGW